MSCEAGRIKAAISSATFHLFLFSFTMLFIYVFFFQTVVHFRADLMTHCAAELAEILAACIFYFILFAF